ncbi:isopenicillin N synthase family oxygenase [Putridiphycobacter roseus]|uniref:Isopenicillin N synthase family oxygenase n=1 Tax=Putridiphycobacter roseus TaxID=2219161 RepID=A0A2W1N5R0_9FLAO|nr:2-oxoglutarate and iron-dependent oxygenase domain-containing protein [Putridiphycobacter roseus]PZE18950.1 isopenicillin N synthase family oxygenase [Putridiphycobacter roseus]
MHKDEIAVVNYLDFLSEDKKVRNSFIEDFGNSFSNMGFAIVKNHGVSEALRKKLFLVSKAFFELPNDIKQQYENLALSGQRGYIAKNRESAKGRNIPDIKEFYHIGQTVKDNDPIKAQYPDNIWPKEVADFESVGLEVYETFEQTGIQLLKAVALYLGLEEDYFQQKVHHGNSILRLLHYYPMDNIKDIPAGAVRAAAHGDINLITLLMGGSAEGLQAQTLGGAWVPVSPKADEIVVNIGDMLARLTNNRFRSTQHRVITPKESSWLTPRYSAPFFLHPRSEMDLTCLSTCIDENNPKSYEDMTAGEFLTERLIELGLKKG